MRMHPSPTAETLSPLVPSVLFCMVSSFPARLDGLQPLSASLQILLVGYMLHPIHDFSVKLFLYGNVSHGRRRRGAMPMPFTGRKPNDITRMDVLDGPAFQLDPPSTGRHDQSLTKWMSVPRCACAWLKRNAGAGYERRIGRLKQRIDAHGASKPIGRSLPGCLRPNSFDLQVLISSSSRSIPSKTLAKIVNIYAVRGSIFTVAERLRLPIIGGR
jgi:hypothetical protein